MEERLESGKPQSVCSPPSEEGWGMSDGSWKFACPSHQGFVGTIQGLQVHTLMVLTFSTQELESFLGRKLCKPEKIGVFLRNSMLHRHGMKRIVKEPPTKTMGSFKEFPEISFSKAHLCPPDVF